MAGKKILDESNTVEGDLETVYSDCLSWLSSIKATVTRTEKPNSITATHGDTPDDETRYTEWPKLIEVRLTQREPYVLVKVVMRETKENPWIKGKDKREAYWRTLIGKLWEHLGIELTPAEKQQTFPVEHFEKETSANVNTAGSVALVFGPISLYLMFFPFGGGLLGVSIVLLLMVIALALRGILRQYQTVRGFKKVHPEKQFSKGRNALIVLALILVSAPVTAAALYSLDIGVSHIDDYETFTGYGFNFEYPEGIELIQSSLSGNASASAGEGLLTGEKMRGLGQSEGLIMSWNTLQEDELQDVDEILDFEGATQVSKVKTTMYQNLEVHYRSFVVNVEDDPVYFHMGTWYHDEHERAFVFMYLNTKNVTAPVFNYMLDSFELDTDEYS